MGKLVKLFLIVLLLGAIGGIAQAQEADLSDLSEMSIEDLMNINVTSASKSEEKRSEAPGIITVITKKEIRAFGANNLNDVLERVTSIQKIGSHLYPNNVTAIRGDLRTHLDNHTLILFNGRPVREGITGGINSPVYLGFPVEMIERIEIIRGPGSVLYGTNAFTGVINIITTDNSSKKSLHVNAQTGSFGTVGGEIYGAVSKGDFKAKLSAKHDNVDGWDYSAMTVHPSPELANEQFDKTYGRQNTGVAADLSYKGLSFIGLYAIDNQDVLGLIPYAPYVAKNSLTRLFMNLGYVYECNDNLESSVNITKNNSFLSMAGGGQYLNDTLICSDLLIEVTINGSPRENVNFVLGGVVDTRNKNKVNAMDAIPKTYNQTNLSAYLQADYRLISILKLIAGAQLNKSDIGDTDVVPRVGAICNFTETIGVKALYSSAFRSAAPIEQFIVNPVLTGNSNLGPEKINTLDIQVFYMSKTAEGSITFFSNSFSNSITRVPVQGVSGKSTYINEGDLHMNGLELEGKITLYSNFYISGSSTILHNADEETVPIYVPKFMGKAGVFYKTKFDLTTGLYNTYFGKPKENQGEKLNPEANGINLLSANVKYKLPISVPIEISVYAQNLLNKTYHYTEFTRGWVNTLPMQPGMGVYGKLSVRF